MSSPLKLVLDMNVLRNKDFIKWVSSYYHGQVVTSPVAYMENKRQLICNGGDPEKLDAILKNARITVELFGKAEANLAANIMSQNQKVCSLCNQFNWADTMIYSSIGCPPTLLVTDNISDFPDDGRVKTPEDVKRLYSRR